MEVYVEWAVGSVAYNQGSSLNYRYKFLCHQIQIKGMSLDVGREEKDNFE